MEYDPKFPDRPLTPEFELLSKIAHSMDTSPGVGTFLSDAEAEAVDYIGKNRTLVAIKALTEVESEAELLMLLMLNRVKLIDLFRVLYLDAFILGTQYEEES